MSDRAPGPPESSPPDSPLHGRRRGIAIAWVAAVVALYAAVRVFALQLVR